MKLFHRKHTNEPRRREADERTADLRGSDTFRRGRTLTGSSSSIVRATNEHAADIKSPRVQSHILTRKRRRVAMLLTGVCVASMGVVFLLWQFIARIDVQATPDMTLAIDKQVYQQAIERYFARQPVERLRFMLDKPALTRFVQSQAPEVESIVDVRGVSFGSSLFRVVVRQPVASWNINGVTRYVDNAGVSFGRTYFGQGGVQIVDESGLRVDDGQAITSNRFLGFVGRIVGLCKESSLSVSRVVIPPTTTREVHVYIKDMPYYVKLIVDRPAGEQVEDMVRTQQWLSQRNITPEQYIDVRVGQRAMYR